MSSSSFLFYVELLPELQGEIRSHLTWTTRLSLTLTCTAEYARRGPDCPPSLPLAQARDVNLSVPAEIYNAVNHLPARAYCLLGLRLVEASKFALLSALWVPRLERHHSLLCPHTKEEMDHDALALLYGLMMLDKDAVDARGKNPREYFRQSSCDTLEAMTRPMARHRRPLHRGCAECDPIIDAQRKHEREIQERWAAACQQKKETPTPVAPMDEQARRRHADFAAGRVDWLDLFDTYNTLREAAFMGQ